MWRTILRRTLLLVVTSLPLLFSTPSFSAPTINWVQLSSRTNGLPSPNGGSQQTASLVVDVDKDGTQDFILCERTSAPSVVWFRRIAGIWTKYIIDNSTLKIEAGGAHFDIDGDGDDDIVFGGDYQSNQVWWWENPYPNFNVSTPWARHIIKNSGGAQHHDELFGKFKGDGTTQLVFWNQGSSTLYIAAIPASPRNDTPWSLSPVYTYSGSIQEGLAKADIDGDGTEDIIGGGKWFKYNGNGTFTANVIDNAMIFSRAAAGQLKAGGRPEVVFSAGDWDGPLKWYEWNGSAWVPQQLLQTVVHGHSLQVDDIDGDGNQDIFSAEMRLDGGNANAKMRVYYGNSQGAFTLSEVSTGYGNHESRLGDLDGDGDLDILAKPYNWNTPRIDVWLNNGTGTGVGSLDLWTYIQADNSRAASAFGNGTFGLDFADVNGDGYKDIASGRYFYRNPGGTMTTTPWPRVTLPNNPQGGRSLDAFLLFDAEGTGIKNDIIAEDLPSVLWLKANDAQGNSWTPTVIAQMPVTSHGNGRTVKSAHIIPSNTKPDILLSGGDGIYLMQIPSNLAGTWPITKITTSNNGEQKAIGIGDIDRDGDLDIAVAVGADRLEVDWWANPGNATAAWTKRVIGNTVATAKMIEVADINGDGRLDVIVTEEARPAGVYWFEAPTDPINGTWTRHTVATGLDEVDSMSGLDMNHDGKPDIVIGEIFGAKRVIVYENQNNGASWTPHTVSTGRESHNGARAVDLNNNGNMDIVSIAYFEFANMHVWRNDSPRVSSVKQKKGEAPSGFRLDQNFPNPFNPSTTITFSIPHASETTLRIVDILGREVSTLMERQLDAGHYEVTFDAAKYTSGIYFYTLIAGSFIATKKMILMK